MKYGLMVYEDTYRGTNIGDYIQSIAARQYLPTVDYLINREKLNSVNDSVKLIMNGWFTHCPQNWPPSKTIQPLFVAFHVNSSHAEKLLTDENINYLKKYQPIGCRDQYTVELLQEKGIEAYFSGCLTLTLDKYKVIDPSEKNDNIYIVDPLFNLYGFHEVFTSFRFASAYILKGYFHQSFKRKNLLKKIISNQIRKRAVYRYHMIKPNHYDEKKRFEIAESLIKEYAHAKLVITSRIHCALPCLALGTPVIFINAFSDESNLSRLQGLTELFNVVNINLKTGKIDATINLDNGIITDGVLPKCNPSAYLKYVDSLKMTCADFINND